MREVIKQTYRGRAFHTEEWVQRPYIRSMPGDLKENQRPCGWNSLKYKKDSRSER